MFPFLTSRPWKFCSSSSKTLHCNIQTIQKGCSHLLGTVLIPTLNRDSNKGKERGITKLNPPTIYV